MLWVDINILEEHSASIFMVSTQKTEQSSLNLKYYAFSLAQPVFQPYFTAKEETNLRNMHALNTLIIKKSKVKLSL
jgi:hypothetical protein